MSLLGKIAVVTGASRGIGRAIARGLATDGARLALCARDEEGLRTTALGLPGAHVLVACDLADRADIARFADRTLAELGVPDVLVHNAGNVVRAEVQDMTDAEWDDVMAVGLAAPFLLTRAFIAKMRARRSGRIVFISSISGTLGTPRLSAYCAAKHGVIGFARALAEETRSEGVQVNVVNPGSVDTDMLKGSGFPPDMQAADIAGVVRYLAGAAPNALTGACVDVFG